MKTRSIPLEGMFINGTPRGRTRVFLKIQDGCDQFCSYCIVPFARGKSRSRSSLEIIKAMNVFYENGVKEVVLTGIEISAYKDPLTGANLKSLLQSLEKAKTPPRIRISSIDPLALTMKSLTLLPLRQKIMKSLHIPLQSGIRHYSKKDGQALYEGIT